MTSDSKTVIVTGAGRGIGAAVAKLCAKQGYRVAVNYCSNQSAAESVVAEINSEGGRAIAIPADVSCERDVLRMFSTSEHELGAVSALVNNAGITGKLCRVEALETEDLRRVLDVNVTGSVLCAREAVRRMSTHRGGMGGAIVNVGSIASELGGSNEWVHYALTKGAIDTFTVGLAKEVAREGIRVNAVSPGTVRTEIHAAAGAPDRIERVSPLIPMGRVGEPSEIAEAILWLLSPAASYVTGAILTVGGGR